MPPFYPLLLPAPVQQLPPSIGHGESSLSASDLAAAGL
ncbi:hypothetical protein X011_27090 [Mycobacterium tuberculosis variant microti OV254]|nr:hypothetical protein X011_27090 [Mycobacterium tuberculosis variant microti OV254]